MRRHFQKDLAWQPDSFYRVREPGYVGHIAEVRPEGLRGEILPRHSIGLWNGQIRIQNGGEGWTAEWDLHGDSRSEEKWDLMALITPVTKW